MDKMKIQENLTSDSRNGNLRGYVDIGDIGLIYATF